jgi:phosphoserine phosphatase
MKRNLAIFDLDNTILNGDSDYSWINFLIEQGVVDKEEYEKKNQYFYDQYYKGKLDYDEWAEFSLTTIKGKKPEEIADLLSNFLSSVIEPMVNIYALRLSA